MFQYVLSTNKECCFLQLAVQQELLLVSRHGAKSQAKPVWPTGTFKLKLSSNRHAFNTAYCCITAAEFLISISV